MNIFKLYRVKLAAIILLLIFVTPASSSFNMVDGIRLERDFALSVISITFNEPIKGYKIDPDLKNRVVRVLIDGSGLRPGIKTGQLSDKKVERIRLFLHSSGSAMAEIYLHHMKTSIYHRLSPDGKTIYIKLKTRKKLLSINTDKKAEKRRAEIKKLEQEQIKLLADVEKRGGRELYIEAMKLFQESKFIEAEKKFTEFTSDYPDSPFRKQGMLMEAESIYRISKKDKDRTADAVDAFRFAAVSYPKSSVANRAKLRIANLYIDMNLDVEAIAVYNSLLKAAPDGKFVISALKGKANVYLKRKKYSLAYNELEKILLLYPAATEVRAARFKIAEAFYHKERYKIALEIFEDSNKKWPSYIRSHPKTMGFFANSHYNLGHKDEAMALYLEMMNLFPDGDSGQDAVNKAADIYIEKGQRSAALRLLGIQARKIPDKTKGIESRLRIAGLSHDKKKLITEETATVITYEDYFHPINTYNEVIEKQVDTEQGKKAYMQKAELLHQKDRYIESILTLKKMMESYPKSRFDNGVGELVRKNLYGMMSRFHNQKGFYTVLATYYENFDPFLVDIKDPNITIKIADAYNEMGLFRKAVEKYQVTSRLDKHGFLKERIRLNKGKAYLSLKEHSNAEMTLLPFTDSLDTSKYAADALHLLGDSYYESGKKLKAIDSYKKAIRISADNKRSSRTAFMVGLLEKQRGRYSDAIKYFKQTINSYTSREAEQDPWYLIDSYYQLIESAHSAGRYRDVLIFSRMATDKYPDNEQNRWAYYASSDSRIKLNEDAKAAEILKELAKTDVGSLYSKVATATLNNLEWKRKHKDLFVD